MPGKEIGPGTRVGEYVLKEKIGEGGFSSVWKAVHHVWTDRPVAVKIPTDRGMIEDLQREAEIQRTLEALGDEHIVKTLGLDASHDPPYFIMEFVTGRSLRDILTEEGALSLDRVLDTASQILKALDHAHGAGVIHMDLKPENVLVTPEGVVKLMDFGMGFRPKTREEKILLSGDLEEDREAFGGTLEYMAPEVRAGDPPDPRVDLYAFGVILFEMLTGERPQPGDVPGDLNPASPKRLDRIFEKCYARLGKRYKTAGTVLRMIEAMRAPAEPKDAGRRRTPVRTKEPPPGMILVPEGSFTFGAGEGGDRGPAHERFLDDFFIDLLPVTNAQFRRFVAAGGYGKGECWGEGWEKVEKFVDEGGAPGPKNWHDGYPPAGKERHPVTGISFFEASAFARWAGKRLPVEEEWEKAARGTIGAAFPWGPKFDPKKCNTRESKIRTTTPAGRYRNGASPYGVLDMAGNVLEWTADFYKAYPGNEAKN
ncbi:MAG: bifunctional serine/threonine-protein kinase/formylglycine-generating enzyme family protein, partial [Planctomycetota bacterium]